MMKSKILAMINVAKPHRLFFSLSFLKDKYRIILLSVPVEDYSSCYVRA